MFLLFLFTVVIVIVAGLAVIYYSYQLNYDSTAEINHSLHNYLFSLLLTKAVVVDGFSAIVSCIKLPMTYPLGSNHLLLCSPVVVFFAFTVADV